MIDYTALVTRLKTRADIRRQIRLRSGDTGRDRIADDLENAALAIEELQERFADFSNEWRDEY